MLKSFFKYSTYILSMLTLIFLYNNCAPSFQANGDFVNSTNTGAGIGGGGNGTPIDQINKLNTAVINDREFNDKVSVDSSGNVNLICQNSDSELSETNASPLTQIEVKNSITAVLGVDANADLYSFFSEASMVKFNENHMASLELLATDTANKFTQSLRDKTNKLWSCDFENSCSTKIINELPSFVWRKKLTNKEKSLIDSYVALFPSGNNNQRLELINKLVHFLIINPQFHIRNSVLSSGSNIKNIADPYETAAKISFSLMYSAPSFEVISKIMNDELKNSQLVKEHYIKMLDDENFQKDFVKNFYGNWFGFKSLLSDNSKFDGHVRSDFAKLEYDRFLSLFKNNSPFSHIIKDSNNGGIFKSKVFADGTYDSPKEGHPEDTSIVRRGIYIMTNIACMKLDESLSPALEAQINAVRDRDDFPHDGSNLVKAAYHRSRAACATCHKYIDPLAIGVEEIGPFGQFRNKYPDNNDIMLSKDPNTNGKYKVGGVEFTDFNSYASLLSKSVDFKSCHTEYLHKRIASSLEDGAKPCFIKKLFNGNQDIGLKDIITNFINSDYIGKTKKPSL